MFVPRLNSCCDCFRTSVGHHKRRSRNCGSSASFSPDHFFFCPDLFFVWFQGVLKGFDQTINVILEECHERVFSVDSPVELVPLGLYVIRGDNM